MNRRRGDLTRNIRDYIVPIIGALLILILIFSVFSGDDENNTNLDENKVGLTLELGSNAEGTIVYPGDYKTEIEGESSLYKGEKVIVKDGSISLDFPTVASFNLNKLGELEYKEDGNFELSSGDLWIDSQAGINLDMKFAQVELGENSHASFSQNEMGSTIYLLSGFAEVSNLAGNSTVLTSGEKLTVSRIEASQDDLDLNLSKEELDEYFTRSEWFIVNNGSFFLTSNSSDEEENSSTGSSISSVSNSNSLISFNNLEDESIVSSSNITVNGSYSDSSITKIVLNGSEAKLNTENKTFSFENVDTSNQTNDLVFRVYDDANDILTKFVYTVFYTNGTSSSSDSSGGFKVKTFDVDGSKFVFTSPITTDTYTTTESFVTIRGSVLIDGIDTVSVNDYELSSFNGTTWRYHADTRYDNLANGTNVYEIKYFSDGKLIYTNYFRIIKKEAVAAPVTTTPVVKEKETETISGEATIN